MKKSSTEKEAVNSARRNRAADGDTHAQAGGPSSRPGSVRRSVETASATAAEAGTGEPTGTAAPSAAVGAPDAHALARGVTAASRYAPISDYAIIGDCHTAALVSREGSIDWLCLPRFDGPAVFAALLDSERGGRFRIRPAEPFDTERRYIDATNVLETTFHTQTGIVRLVDLMPVGSEPGKRERLDPDHEVLRILECIAGEVEVELIYDPRPEYGRVTPRIEPHGPLGWWCDAGPHQLTLLSEVPLERADGRPGLSGSIRLRAGERKRLALEFTEQAPTVLAPLGRDADASVERTLNWWRAWAKSVHYTGPYRDQVLRSALTLKLMTYAPSGAVVAAPTTSLPEEIRGIRNWDYRYCWLRDASLTLDALFELGCTAEGDAFFAWLLHATRLTAPRLRVLYGVHGETHLPERELEHLEGYMGSSPVRVGNDAAGQLQLDMYGELVEAAWEFTRRGGVLDSSTKRLLVGFGRAVCRRWREPDEGIWEIRAGRRQHTYSKAMCWVALDRLLRMQRHGRLHAPIAEFTRTKEEIRAAIEAHGYNEEIGSYVSSFDGEDLDASLLLLALYGYAPADSARMRSTCARVRERLGAGGLLYRYRTADGLAGGEGAFGICSFWCAECMAITGDLEAAIDVFEGVLAYANDVGLFSEEYDPGTGAALGNFPQAFTHLGLIHAAIELENISKGRAARPERIEAVPAGGAEPEGYGSASGDEDA